MNSHVRAVLGEIDHSEQTAVDLTSMSNWVRAGNVGETDSSGRDQGLSGWKAVSDWKGRGEADRGWQSINADGVEEAC